MRKDTQGGLYQILFRIDAAATVRVGRLGTFRFPAGDYVYTGSAKGGLEARIGRHLRSASEGQARSHWHIDYLLPHGRILAVVRFPFTEGGEPCPGECDFNVGDPNECDLNRRLPRSIAAAIPAPGFGSSDCRCESHLVYLGTMT